MPRTRQPLPDPWASTPFLTRDFARTGGPGALLSHPALSTPFNVVRMPVGELEPQRLAAAFALRAGPGQVFSHTTALLLWGAPLPNRIEQQRKIHVSSIGESRPRTGHTVPHLLQPARTPTSSLGGYEITEPAVSWVQSAPLLSLDDLVAAGDFLITGTEPFDGAPPLCRPQQLTDAIRIQRGARGIRRAREALALVRYGSLSRQETFMRLMFARGRLPNPEVNYSVVDGQGNEVAMVDLAFPEFRVACEYESLLHLDPQKFRRDIRKVQDLAAIEWATHRLTSEDVDAHLRTPASRTAVARIRRALRDRGWTPPE